MAKGRQAQETAETMRPMPRPNTKRPMPRPTEPITRGTLEQGAAMFKFQQEQLKKQEEEARKRFLQIDPDNYIPPKQ